MRLKGYDYASQNYYFITVCSHNMSCIFGKPDNLNLYGRIAKEQLLRITNHFPDVRIDKYVIMQNHIHAIIVIGCNGETERSRPFPTLSTIMGLYKSGVTKCIHKFDKNITVWQKSYYENVIRNADSYSQIVRYIKENPIKWELDKYYNCN